MSDISSTRVSAARRALEHWERFAVLDPWSSADLNIALEAIGVSQGMGRRAKTRISSPAL
jgi:hypothetical protein